MFRGRETLAWNVEALQSFSHPKDAEVLTYRHRSRLQQLDRHQLQHDVIPRRLYRPAALLERYQEGPA